MLWIRLCWIFKMIITCELCLEHSWFLYRSAIGFPSLGVWHSTWPSILVWCGFHWFCANGMAVYSTNRTTYTLVPGSMSPRDAHLCKSGPASDWSCTAYCEPEVSMILFQWSNFAHFWECSCIVVLCDGRDSMSVVQWLVTMGCIWWKGWFIVIYALKPQYSAHQYSTNLT